MAFVGWPLRLVARTAKWLETTAHQCVVSAPTSSTCTALRSGYQAWTTSTPAPSVDKSGGDDLGWSTASLGHRGARNFAVCVCACIWTFVTLLL